MSSLDQLRQRRMQQLQELRERTTAPSLSDFRDRPGAPDSETQEETPAASPSPTAPPLFPQDTGGPVEAFGESAAQSVVPTAGGIAGAYGGAKAGGAIGAGIGSAIAPGVGTAVGGGIGGVVGAIGGGIAGGSAASYAQEETLEAIVGEDERQDQLERRAAQRDEYPVATFLGEVAPSVLAFRPSVENIRRTGQFVRQAASSSGRRTISRRPGEAAVAADVLGGAGVSTGVEAARQAQEGEFRPGRLAGEAAAGALLSDPNRLGRRIGFRPHESQGEAAVRRALARADERRRQSGRPTRQPEQEEQLVARAVSRAERAEGRSAQTPRDVHADRVAERATQGDPRSRVGDTTRQPLRQPRWRTRAQEAREGLTQARERARQAREALSGRRRQLREAEQEAGERARAARRATDDPDTGRTAERVDPEGRVPQRPRRPARTAREARQRERADAQQRLQRLREDMQARRSGEQAIQNRLVRIIQERVPRSAQGQLLTTVRDARTPRTLDQGIRRVERVIAREEATRDVNAMRLREIEDTRETVRSSIQPIPSAFRARAEQRIAQSNDPDRMVQAAEQAVDRYERTRAQREIKDLLGNPRRLQSLTPAQRDRVYNELGDVDVRPMGRQERRRARAAARHIQNHPDDTLPDSLMQSVERLNRRQINDMSTDELLEAADTVRTARHLSRTSQTLQHRQRQERVANYTDTIVNDITARPAMQHRLSERIRQRAGIEPHRAPMRRSFGVLLREWSARPETILEDMSPALRTLVWERIGVQGFREYLGKKQQASDGLRDVLSRNGRPMGERSFDRWQFEQVDTGTVGSLTRSERIHLSTLVRDPDNAERILNNGITIDRLRRTVKPSAEDIDRLRSGDILDRAERSAAEYMFREYNTRIRDMMNEASRREYGVDWFVRDDTVPRTIDAPAVDRNSDPIDALRSMKNSTLQSYGHLKRRQGTTDPISIGNGFDAFLNHADNISRVSSYLTPVNDALKVLRQRRVRESITSRFGKSGYDRVADAIRMQTVPTQDPNNLARLTRRLMRYYGASVLGLRLSTMMLNPSGMFTAAPYVGFRNMGQAAAEVGANPSAHQRIAREASQFSPYYRERYQQNYAKEALSGMAQGNERRYGGGDLADMGMRPIQWSDQFGGNIRWRAAELHTQRLNPDMSPDSAQFKQQVAEEWERMMYRSENTGHGMEMPFLLAEGRRNPFVSPFVMFSSSVSKIYSGGLRAIDQANKGQYQAALASAAGFLGSLAYAVGVREMIAQGRGNLEDDDRPLAQRAITNFVAEASGQVPFFGNEIFSPMVQHIGGGNVWHSDPPILQVFREGFDGMTAISDSLDAWWNATVDANGERVAQQRFAEAMQQLVTVGSRFTGAPVDGAKDVARIVNNVTGELPAESRTDIRNHLNKTLDELARQDGRLTASEQREQAQQANGRIFRALRYHAPGMTPDQDMVRSFERGVRERINAGMTVDRGTLRSMVQGRYGRFTQIANDEEAFGQLSADDQDMVRLMISERDRMLEAIDDLIQTVSLSADADTSTFP